MNGMSREPNLFEAIADQAAQASRRQLLLLLGLGGLGLAAAWYLARVLPVLGFTAAAFGGAVGCLALWELAGRTRKVGYAGRRLARAVLAIAGISLVIVAALAALVALLGDSWKS